MIADCIYIGERPLQGFTTRSTTWLHVRCPISGSSQDFSEYFGAELAELDSCYNGWKLWADKQKRYWLRGTNASKNQSAGGWHVTTDNPYPSVVGPHGNAVMEPSLVAD